MNEWTWRKKKKVCGFEKGNSGRTRFGSAGFRWLALPTTIHFLAFVPYVLATTLINNQALSGLHLLLEQKLRIQVLEAIFHEICKAPKLIAFLRHTRLSLQKK
jgi:hypothetical protein